MTTHRLIAAALAAFILAGCASAPRGADYVPLVDLRGKDAAQLATDTAECQVYARQTMDAAEGAVTGAIAGAIVGALLGAALAQHGYRNDWAAHGAAFGAIGGGASGAVQANDTQESITKRCLAGRGYSVLN